MKLREIPIGEFFTIGNTPTYPKFRTSIGYVASFILGVLALIWQTILMLIFLSITIALIARYTKKSQEG